MYFVQAFMLSEHSDSPLQSFTASSGIFKKLFAPRLIKEVHK